ncbi:hypothetical protein B9T62_35870 [Paenibacillus donghaensis]|uniref:Uncharacterized protein n=1 Tax=Paenibacillus donghaensis TaxID=414771 RepID=A0A2Z2KW56_9BACL|nr:hypothetical protein B9T62_35870 [Paenibacillus donghaensis]
MRRGSGVALIKKMWNILCCLILCIFVHVQKSEASGSNVTLKLPNGASYYGEVKNGKPSGKGTMIWSKSKSYSGEWIEGKRSGYGKYISVE